MFPDQAYCMLQDAEKQGLTSIVSWVGSQGHFRVFDRDRFEQFVLPRYFGTANYKSFQRQLNLYGFECVRRLDQEMTGCYFHPHFHRDRPPKSNDFLQERTRRQRRQQRRSEDTKATVKDSNKQAASSTTSKKRRRRPGTDLPARTGAEHSTTSPNMYHNNLQETASLSSTSIHPDPLFQSGDGARYPRHQTMANARPLPAMRPSRSLEQDDSHRRIFVDWLCRVPDEIQAEIVATFCSSKQEMTGD